MAAMPISEASMADPRRRGSSNHLGVRMIIMPPSWQAGAALSTGAVFGCGSLPNPGLRRGKARG